MSTGLTVAIVLGVGAYALKAAAPLALGSRQLPKFVLTLATLLPAALLAAFVVVATIGGTRRYEFDARILGVLAAAVALWRKQNFIVVVVVAAVVTALARRAGLG